MIEREPTPNSHDIWKESRVSKILGKLTRSGGISIPRIGGGVRVAVIPYNAANPNSIVEQTLELKRARESCMMPFDEIEDAFTHEVSE